MTDFIEAAANRKRTTGLSEETAKARRSLIAVTALWGAITFFELVPTELSFLGINLENARVSPQLLVAFVGLYFWVSYLIYGFRDWIEWVRSWSSEISGLYSALKRRRESDDGAEDLIRKLEADGVPRTKRVPMKWPDDDQENSIEDVERSLHTWKRRGTDLARELQISITDVTVRTLWEFGLPFACGMTINLWMFFRAG